MLVPCFTGQFRRDLKRLEKSGNKDTGKLKAVMNFLIEGNPLSARHRDHSLTGNYQNRRECHIEPDWLLIYKIDQQTFR
ncbi:MAG TPA: type II toxin-antitoxin system mRNA interferase toxin, RelE/StbE family [Deltaproteobacteria bacterium]|nr:type II toxin-antitoxin system mRNA interferase toxin, RelE/StbE family [Deltaproteobacteria bacterium]